MKFCRVFGDPCPETCRRGQELGQIQTRGRGRGRGRSGAEVWEVGRGAEVAVEVKVELRLSLCPNISRRLVFKI